jgi:hypothetical protein
LPDGTYMFEPKIPVWVHFWEPTNGQCCYRYIGILCPVGKYYWHLVYFMAILVIDKKLKSAFLKFIVL